MDRENLRLKIYRTFAETAKAPSLSELANHFGSTIEDVRSTLGELAQARHLVLDEHSNIVMAHPFSSIPLGFSVMGAQNLWWGGCAWDSFALVHLLKSEPELLVASACPNCKKGMAWLVNDRLAPAGDELAHFLVPTAEMWNDVVHTCNKQRIFCSRPCIDSWLAETGNSEGYVMTLEVLWRLASKWYEGRLDEGYQRREPAEAKQYFIDAGLTGKFWGL